MPQLQRRAIGQASIAIAASQAQLMPATAATSPRWGWRESSTEARAVVGDEPLLQRRGGDDRQLHRQRAGEGRDGDPESAPVDSVDAGSIIFGWSVASCLTFSAAGLAA